MENGLTKRKIINSSKLVLYSPNKGKEEYDWDKTYFICGDYYLGIKGTNFGKTTIKDKWMSELLKKEVYIVTMKHQPVSQIVPEVYAALNGISVSAEKAMRLLFMLESDNSFRYINLITDVTTEKGLVNRVQTNKILRTENHKLMLDISIKPA